MNGAIPPVAIGGIGGSGTGRGIDLVMDESVDGAAYQFWPCFDAFDIGRASLEAGEGPTSVM